MEAAAGMVGSGGFFWVENGLAAGFGQGLGGAPPAVGCDGGSGLQRWKIGWSEWEEQRQSSSLC